jgi:hypothetical protein
MKEKGSGETSNRPPQQGGGGSNRQRQRRPRKKNNRQLDGRDDRDRCRNCGKLGHWAKDCRQPRHAQANLARAEQVDEPALLMAQLTSLSSIQSARNPFTSTSAMLMHSLVLLENLKEEVYVCQPPGFVVLGQEHKVLRLRKAFYGLR